MILSAQTTDKQVNKITQKLFRKIKGRRLGLSEGKNPLAVEEEICRLIPRELWRETHHRLIAHGRRVCRARKPLCSSCSLSPYCPSAGEKIL